MSLASLTRPDLILTDLQAADRPQVLHELAARLARRGVTRDPEELFRDLWEREQQGSTGIGGGVAIPHCKLRGLAKPVVALGLLAAGVDFEAADGQPVLLIVLILSPSESPAAHLQALAVVSRWIKSGRYREILGLLDAQAVYDVLEQEGG
ncbi:MAG TPA: PTS sugar transporter subunit IIA [Thermoanaerobaculia bacterium]|jgi:fructose-specific phosphotransferase system IIA component|nr:PTS sugar transporter subunit IIA [Thermoanaerobaculia bacterium]